MKVIVLSGVIFLSLFACNSNSSDTKYEFDKSFRSLYLVHNSPDFPGSLTVYKYCLKDKNEGCFKVLQGVQKAKAHIKKAEHDIVLQVTLNAISKHCNFPIKRDDPNEAVCEGALNALYFFNDSGDDEKILNKFRVLDKDKNKRIFKRNREWFYNRKNTQAWQVHVQEMLSGEELKLQKFRFKQKAPKPFGLMYLETPIPDGDTLVY